MLRGWRGRNDGASGDEPIAVPVSTALDGDLTSVSPDWEIIEPLIVDIEALRTHLSGYLEGNRVIVGGNDVYPRARQSA